MSGNNEEDQDIPGPLEFYCHNQKVIQPRRFYLNSDIKRNVSVGTDHEAAVQTHLSPRTLKDTVTFYC